MGRRRLHEEGSVVISTRVSTETAQSLSDEAEIRGVSVAVVARERLDTEDVDLPRSVALLREGRLEEARAWLAAADGTGLVLPATTEAVPWVEGVTVTASGGGTDVRPAVRVPTEDGAKLVDQGTGEVLAVEKAKRPTRQTTAEELGMDPDAVAEKLEPDHVAMVGGRPWVPSKDQPKRPKVQHHDDAIIGGGALVKCRRCTLVKNAARPEVCDA